MNRPQQPDESGLPIYEPDDHAAYSTEICARITGVSTETIIRYHQQGFIRPLSDPDSGSDTDSDPCSDSEPDPASLVFDDEALRTVRKIEHLRNTCGVNESGLKLILSLIEEIETLRDSLRARR